MRYITVSYSEIAAWRACPLKHWLDYRMRQPGSSGPAADLGTTWHLMMADWYEGRRANVSIDQLASTIPAYRLGWEPRSEDEQELIAKALWMWDGWLQKGDPFRDAQVLAVEHEWHTPLPRVPGQPDDVEFVLKTIVDLVVQRGGRLIVVDHKSQAKFENAESLGKDMDMDDQLGLYLYSARYRGAKARATSACWSYACTTDLKKEPRPADQRFWQVWSARTDAAIDSTAVEAAESALAAYTRPLAVQPPRHTDKEHCRWRCSHRTPCYYARDTGRPVELTTPTRADQAPDGVSRLGY